MRVKRRNKNLLKNFTGYTPVKKYSHGGLYHDDDGNPVDKDGKPLPSNIPLTTDPLVSESTQPVGYTQPVISSDLQMISRPDTLRGISDEEYEEQTAPISWSNLLADPMRSMAWIISNPGFGSREPFRRPTKFEFEQTGGSPMDFAGQVFNPVTYLQTAQDLAGDLTELDRTIIASFEDGRFSPGDLDRVTGQLSDAGLKTLFLLGGASMLRGSGVGSFKLPKVDPSKGRNVYGRSLGAAADDLIEARGIVGKVPEEFGGSDIVRIPGRTSPMTLPASATDELISSAVSATQPIVSPQGVYDYGISEIDNIAGAANDIISSSYAQGLSESATSGSDELIANIRDAVKSNTSYGIIDPASVLPDQIMFENFPQAGRNEIADVIDQTIFETSGFDALSPDLEELLMGVSNVLRDPGSLVRSLGYKPEIAGGWKLAAGSNPNSFLYSPPGGGGYVSASKVQLPNRSIWDLGIMPSSSKSVGPRKNMQLIAELTDQIPIGESFGIISASVDAYPLLVNASTRDRIQIAKAGSDQIYADDVNTTLTKLNQGDDIIHYRPLNGFGQGNFPTLTAEETDFLLNSGKYLGVRDSNVQVLSEADRAAAKDRMDGVLGKVNAYLNKKGFPDAKVSDDFEILLPYPELVATRPRKPGEVLRRGGYITKKKRKKGYGIKKR
jgi:hypothetical protein